MDNNGRSLKKTARLAGLLYVLMSIQAPIALLYVPSHIIVSGSSAATVNNLIAHEFLFRLSVVSQLFSIIIFMFLALALYRLFNQVNDFQSKLLVAFVLLQVPMTFIFETLSYTALMIAKGEILQAVQTEQRQALVMMLLKIHGYGLVAAEIFWGLWLLPFGQLVYKSGFIPKIFGFLLCYGGVCWIADSITSLLFPSYSPLVSEIVLKTGWIGEIPIMLWLLIKGVKTNIVAINKES
jgi:Domain of unknown function (DUF4386)